MPWTRVHFQARRAENVHNFREDTAKQLISSCLHHLHGKQRTESAGLNTVWMEFSWVLDSKVGGKGACLFKRVGVLTVECQLSLKQGKILDLLHAIIPIWAKTQQNTHNT